VIHRMWTFDVPAVPPYPRAGQKVDASGRPIGGRYLPRSLKKAQADIGLCALAAGVPRLGKREVGVGLQLAVDARGDIDNRLKTLLDALEKARIVDNDRQVCKVSVDRTRHPGATPIVTVWVVGDA
jgi:hypothetical protein